MTETTGHRTTADGLRLFYRVWLPPEPQGSIVLVHGMNEHTGRYRHVAAYFTRLGFAVYAPDQRGFGQSEGARCHVNRFAEYLEDLRPFAEMACRHGRRSWKGTAWAA